MRFAPLFLFVFFYLFDFFVADESLYKMRLRRDPRNLSNLCEMIHFTQIAQKAQK